MLEAFTSPSSPLSDEFLRSLLEASWGITAVSIDAFGSERHDTVKIGTDDADYVLKVAPSTENPSRIAHQLSLMNFVAQRDLPFAVQRPIETLSGEQAATYEGHTAHLLPFLPGTPIRHSSLNRDGVMGVGEAVWQLQREMAHYLEPYDTVHPWALASVNDVLTRVDTVTPDALREGCELVLRAATASTLPRLAELPSYPTHNDVHTDNVLVEGQVVVGIVDWGDSVTQPHVADLAVAASYARDYHPMWREGDPWQAATTLREGYLAAGGPEDSEDLFGELVLARLAHRIVLNLAVAATAIDGGVYATRNMVSSVRDANDLFVTRPPGVFPELRWDPLW